MPQGEYSQLDRPHTGSATPPYRLAVAPKLRLGSTGLNHLSILADCERVRSAENTRLAKINVKFGHAVAVVALVPRHFFERAASNANSMAGHCQEWSLSTRLRQVISTADIGRPVTSSCQFGPASPNPVGAGLTFAVKMFAGSVRAIVTLDCGQMRPVRS